MSRQWVIQEVLSADSGDDWDLWILGTIDGDRFLDHFRTYDHEMADWLLNAIRWYETFEDGTIKPAIAPRVRTRTKK